MERENSYTDNMMNMDNLHPKRSVGESKMAAGQRTNATMADVNAASISLKEHYDELIDQVCKTVDAKFSMIDERFRSQEKALDLQQEINNKKFEGQNEWRGAMTDREKAYITRQDHESLITLLNTKEDALKKDIRELLKSKDILDGKASQSQLNITFIFVIVGFIFSGIGVLCSLSGLLLSIYLH
jgi:hypothetical protein